MKENHNTPESGKLIAEYGAANLVFAMEIDCFDEVGVMMGAMIGAGLVSAGENTRRVPMVARERHYRFDENFKIELQGFDREDFTIPYQTLYFSDFNAMIRQGLVNVYVQTPDGFMPIYQCVQECMTEKEARIYHRVQDNFFLRTSNELLKD